jgi:hypothetical protein
MIKRTLGALLALALMLAPAAADYNVRDGSGASKTIEAVDHGGKILPKSVPSDSSGNEISPATQATLAAVLAKLTSDPATQTTLAAFLAANHTDLAAVLAKLSADPATQTTLVAVLAKLSSDPATQTTLAAVLAKLTSDPATSAKQDTTNTDLGAPGATVCATDTGSCSLNALLQRIAQRLTTMVATLNAPMQQTGGVVGLTTQGYASTGQWPGATNARTGDTNAYLANDVVGANVSGGGGVLTFAGIGPAAGGEVLITSIRFEIDASAVISGETSYNLWCYNGSPPSAFADNAPFDIPSGDRTSQPVKIPLGTPVDEGSTLLVETDVANKQVTVPVGGALSCYLVTVGPYTPTSGRAYVVTLHATKL